MCISGIGRTSTTMRSRVRTVAPIPPYPSTMSHQCREGKVVLKVSDFRVSTLQGGPSGCTLRFVDIKLRVAFWYKEGIMWRNFCIDINKRWCTTWWNTLFISRRNFNLWALITRQMYVYEYMIYSIGYRLGRSSQKEENLLQRNSKEGDEPK